MDGFSILNFKGLLVVHEGLMTVDKVSNGHMSETSGLRVFSHFLIEKLASLLQQTYIPLSAFLHSETIHLWLQKLFIKEIGSLIILERILI